MIKIQIIFYFLFYVIITQCKRDDKWAFHRNIVLLGDSITEMSLSPNLYGNLLAQKFTRNADVFNRGFSGYTSRWLLQSLPYVLPVDDEEFNHDIILISVFIGVNDVLMGHTSDEYVINVKTIIQYIVDLGKHIDIIVVIPHVTCVHGSATAATIPYATKLRNANITLLHPDKIHIIDLQRPDLGFGCSDLKDGLHLNEAGGLKLYNEFEDIIDKTYYLRPDRHQFLPNFNALMHTNASTSEIIIKNFHF